MTRRICRMLAGIALVVAATAQTALAVPPPGPEVPEIDPSSAGTAVALLVGTVMLFVSRRRRHLAE